MLRWAKFAWHWLLNEARSYHPAAGAYVEENITIIIKRLLRQHYIMQLTLLCTYAAINNLQK